jgi:glucan phosphoethanolaminetransferase (alkaline phosphatase superfamily)
MQLYSETLSGENKEVKEVRARDWLIAFCYILFIYISLPVMPRLWEKFVQKAGIFANYFAAFILSFSGVLIILYLIAKKKNIYNFIWLAILALAYAWGLSRLKFPIEKMHFIEYGLLSIFVFKALRHNIKSRSIYLYSALIVFCVGFLDESIQYVLPNRVYDAKDVIVDGAAGILSLLLIGLCFQPQLGLTQIAELRTNK